MPRWKQVKNPETGKNELIPIGEAPRGSAGAAIHGDIESFVSPIDGTVIRDRKQYREHCKKHNVVPTAEFSQEFFERKAKERARVYTGERTKEEILKSKQQLWEIYHRHERGL